MPLETDDDLLARADEIARHAVGVAGRGRRRHAPLVFYWQPDGELALEPLQGRLDRAEAAFARVAREVVRRDARGIVVVGEGWSELAGEGGPGEALVVAALARSGRERTWAAPIARRRLTGATVGALVAADGHHPAFLAPVREAWGLAVEEA